METIQKIKVEDKTRIKHIHFKHPELMGKDAEKMVKSEYRELLNVKEKLYAAREEVRKLEKLYGTLEADWNSKKEMFDIEFESYEKEVKTTKSYMTINGKTVYDCNSKR